MLIDKERLISDLRVNMSDPKELHDVLMTVDEQPGEDSINDFIDKFHRELIEICDPMNRNDDVIEIRGRLFIRVPVIGRLLIQCAIRKDI